MLYYNNKSIFMLPPLRSIKGVYKSEGDQEYYNLVFCENICEMLTNLDRGSYRFDFYFYIKSFFMFFFIPL